ncbi:hypothetical protein D1839_02505 [Roseburia sp. 1XD42-34]|nr:hypothetical protein [Roseburia sp. 1XD42-34]
MGCYLRLRLVPVQIIQLLKKEPSSILYMEYKRLLPLSITAETLPYPAKVLAIASINEIYVVEEQMDC